MQSHSRQKHITAALRATWDLLGKGQGDPLLLNTLSKSTLSKKWVTETVPSLRKGIFCLVFSEEAKKNEIQFGNAI